MKVALYGRQINSRHLVFIQRLLDKMCVNQNEVYLFKPFYNQLLQEIPESQLPTSNSIKTFDSAADINDQFDFMFSLGGDGTLLDTVTLVGNQNIPIVGINIGRLGFLANIGKEDLDDCVEALSTGSYISDKRSLIELQSNEPIFGNTPFALNDFTIHKRDSSPMIVIHTFINGELLNSYWADGLIVSTPTGSTGYNLSCGGPVVLPQSNNLVITPIAPHHLNVRSIVVSDESVISFEVEGRGNEFICTLDARSQVLKMGTQLAVKRANHSISLVRLSDNNFLNTLTQKLNWGKDARN